jgi:hypothetical protein
VFVVHILKLDSILNWCLRKKYFALSVSCNIDSKSYRSTGKHKQILLRCSILVLKYKFWPLIKLCSLYSMVRGVIPLSFCAVCSKFLLCACAYTYVCVHVDMLIMGKHQGRYVRSFI